MSLSGVTSLLPIACSGDMYVGVPTAMPVFVSVSPPATYRVLSASGSAASFASAAIRPLANSALISDANSSVSPVLLQ